MRDGRYQDETLVVLHMPSNIPITMGSLRLLLPQCSTIQCVQLLPVTLIMRDQVLDYHIPRITWLCHRTLVVTGIKRHAGWPLGSSPIRATSLARAIASSLHPAKAMPSHPPCGDA
jgi:hypothetical protein